MKKADFAHDNFEDCKWFLYTPNVCKEYDSIEQKSERNEECGFPKYSLEGKLELDFELDVSIHQIQINIVITQKHKYYIF